MKVCEQESVVTTVLVDDGLEVHASVEPHSGSWHCVGGSSVGEADGIAVQVCVQSTLVYVVQDTVEVTVEVGTALVAQSRVDVQYALWHSVKCLNVWVPSLRSTSVQASVQNVFVKIGEQVRGPSPSSLPSSSPRLTCVAVTMAEACGAVVDGGAVMNAGAANEEATHA